MVVRPWCFFLSYGLMYDVGASSPDENLEYFVGEPKGVEVESDGREGQEFT